METLGSIQARLNALKPFQLQAEFSVPGEDNDIAYVDRVPSKVLIDVANCMLSYPDQRAHEPAWSFAEVDKVEVQTDVAFHADSDARNGESRREMSASPASSMLVVSMKSGNGWPMHVWGILDGSVAEEIANAMRRAATLCSAGGRSAPERGKPVSNRAVGQR